MKKLEVILATTPRGEIGYRGTIPWSLTGDLTRFKTLTTGQVVLMGRKTYESLPVPLKGRTVVVISETLMKAALLVDQCHDEVSREVRRSGLGATLSSNPEAMVYVARTLSGALSIAQSVPLAETIFIAGGAELYRWALRDSPRVSKIWLTTVYKDSPNGYDTTIPDFNLVNFDLWGVNEYPMHQIVRPVYEYDSPTNQMILSHTYSEYVRKDVK